MWYFLIFPVIFVLWRVYRCGGVWQIISSLAYIAVSGGISIGIFKTVMKQNLLKKKKRLKVELDRYGEQLTQSYLSDKDGEGAAVRAIYDRYGEVLEWSHILLRLKKSKL